MRFRHFLIFLTFAICLNAQTPLPGGGGGGGGGSAVPGVTPGSVGDNFYLIGAGNAVLTGGNIGIGTGGVLANATGNADGQGDVCIGTGGPCAAITTGSEIVAVGQFALHSYAGTGLGAEDGLIVAVGTYSCYNLLSNTSFAANAVCVGQKSALNATSLNGDVFVGSHSGASVLTSTDSILLGRSVLDDSIAGDKTTNDVIAIGRGIMGGTGGTSSDDIIIGKFACETCTSVNNAIIMGNGAAGNATTLTPGLIAIGGGGVINLTTGTGIFMGLNVAQNLTTGTNDIVFGTILGSSTTTSQSVVMGFNTATGGPLGNNSTLIGYAIAQAGLATGNQAITAIGASSLNGCTTCANDFAGGYRAGASVTTSTDDVFVGFQAGEHNTTGGGNTFLGSDHNGYNPITTGGQDITIGYDVGGMLSATGSGQIDIGNALFCTGATGVNTTITGTCGVGTATPGVTWDVVGTNRASKYATATVCVSSSGTCGSAASGFVAVPAGSAQTLVVSDSIVTANSQIHLTEDQSLGTALGVTCDTTSIVTIGAPYVSARSVGASFTAKIDGVSTNPVCLSYSIIN